MKMQVHHHAFSCHRGMLVKNEISQTIEDKRLTKSINRLQNMGMMSNDGICPRFCQSGGKHALAYRGLSLKLHSPMKYDDNPDVWPRGMIMLDCLCQLVSRRLAYARAFIGCAEKSIFQNSSAVQVYPAAYRLSAPADRSVFSPHNTQISSSRPLKESCRSIAISA